MKYEAPATQRNRDPIWAILKDYLLENSSVLEIASGSGEHASYFCQLNKNIQWQPSDKDLNSLASLQAWAQEIENLKQPLVIDIEKSWEVSELYDICFCCNMVHISPWSASIGLFRNLKQHLKKGGYLLLYGPFLENQVQTAASNLAFDASLKAETQAGASDKKKRS